MPQLHGAPSLTIRLHRQYSDPWDNLRLYLQEATLSPLILDASAPHRPSHRQQQSQPYTLSNEPDSRYRLRHIRKYRTEVMEKRILQFCQKYIPDTHILNAESIGVYVRAAYMALRARSFSRMVTWRTTPVLDMEHMVGWMMVPLLAAERTMNLTWPELTKGYAFMTTARQKLAKLGPQYDVELCRQMWWQKPASDSEKELSSWCKLVVLSMAPWALSFADIQEFVRMGEFPAYQQPTNGSPAQKFNRTEKIWAKLAEICASKHCPLFVLSTYETWVFGTFADGFTKAVVSRVLRHSDRSPNVLQWLVYWMASSLKLEGSYVRLIRHNENADLRHPKKVTILDNSERLDENDPELYGEWESSEGEMLYMEGESEGWVTSFI